MTTNASTVPLITPNLESIAFFVKTQRGFRYWKQQTLAAMAGVSLSTIERVERGEPVTPKSLRKIATALGFPADYMTEPRRKLTETEALAAMLESLTWMDGRVEVSVAPLTTERQLRELASSDMIVTDSDLGDAVADDLAELQEWLDLVGFLRSTNAELIGPKPERGFRMRELYRDLFAHLDQLQVRHRAVCLVGTYSAETDDLVIPTATVAVIAIRSKVQNPAVAKFKTLWCEQKVSWKNAMEHLP
jgi:transcriptional regulator with XRE-family HTH domain